MKGVGILGLGHALPAAVRSNDDPLFDAIKREHAETDLFYGVEERRAITSQECVEDLMCEASEAALEAAGVKREDIDRLYGAASISEYLTPNGLFRVHRDLGLSSRAPVLPLNAEFTTFILSCVASWEAIAAGACRHTLIACGAHWTPHANYTMPYSMVIGDGAAAAVVGPRARLTFVDFATETLSDLYDGMTIRARAGAGDAELTFGIQESGRRAFMSEGVEVLPRLALALLAKHGVRSDQVALVTHESSKRLIEAWGERVRPAEYPNHLGRLGDMPGCSVPVTLSMCESTLRSPYIVLMSPGTGMHFAVLLLRRTASG